MSKIPYQMPKLLIFSILVLLSFVIYNTIPSIIYTYGGKESSNSLKSPSPIYTRNNSNITTDLDFLKFRNTNTKLCDIWERSKIMVGSQHKTGSILLIYQFSQHYLQRYLNQNCYTQNQTFVGDSLYKKGRRRRVIQRYGLSPAHIHQFYTESLHFTKLKNVKTFYHFTVLNIVRNPVDAVISEYNYDKKSNEGVSVNVMDNNYTNKCIKNVWFNLTNKINNITMDKLSRFSIQSMLNHHLSIQDGIIAIFYQYKYCYLEQLYESYVAINYYQNKSVENDHYHFYNFRLEDFKINFNQTAQTYLNKVGVLEQNHRQKLMNLFVLQDPSKITRKHATSGSYDKQQQLRYLLSSQERCNYLKKYVILMDYNWSYPQYC